MHYEKYLINLSKQEKLNLNAISTTNQNNNINNQNENQNTLPQSKEINKANVFPNFNAKNQAMGNMQNIPPQMANFMQGNMAATAGMGNLPFNFMRPGMPFMPMNPQMAAKMMGKMNPNANFPQ